MTPRRVAFVGAEPVFGPAVAHGELIDLTEPPRTAEIRAALARRRPHATVVLGPPFPPPETLAGAGLVLAFTTEAADLPWADRTIATDQRIPAWRHVPLPVADHLFADVAPSAAPPRVLFLGRSTPHRESVLSAVKHDFDVLHVADGVRGEELVALLARTDVGLNAHRTSEGGFEHRVPLHLARGHLVVSETLDPAHGLEADIDFLEVRDGRAMHRVVAAVRRHPQMHRRVRIRGRLKAERFRASRVWPRVVEDAFRDVAAFGSAKQRPS